MTATVTINGRRPRRTPRACLPQHARWLIAAAAVLLLRRPSDHKGRPTIFAAASSIRRPGTSSRKTSSGSNGGTSKTIPLPAHCRPNRFVSASPLAVAAVCRDGVVIAAVHTSPALEPLLLAGAVGDGVQEQDPEQEEDGGTPDHHLPRAYRGPFRVTPVDGYGTTLLSAGWRSDCHSLAAKCRSLAAEEAANYMHDDLGSASAVAAAVPNEDYAAGIASDAALWLAKCAISGGIRTRNCVGLLASCCSTKADDDDTTSNAAGRLHLIDAAGVHRVRALAMGHGSDDVNRRLLGVDFANLGRDEAMQKLMDVIFHPKSQDGGEGGENDGKDDDDIDDDDDDDDDDDGEDDINTDALDNTDAKGDQSSTNRWQLPKGSRVELAFVDAKRRQMTRINQRIQ